MFKSILKKSKELYEQGFIKSINNNTNGVGLTLEKLLGKDEDNFSYPEIERIGRTYGYYDYTAENMRILNAEFCKDKNNLISNRYFFNMGIDNDEKKIYLSVYDINHNLIAKSSYWYFEDIKEKLEIKMKYLALFIAKSKKMLKWNYSTIIESSVMSINLLNSF